MVKYVYLFKEGDGSMRELLGGKGANLAEMTNLGMHKTNWVTSFSSTSQLKARHWKLVKFSVPSKW